jgi:hypothetical protein
MRKTTFFSLAAAIVFMMSVGASGQEGSEKQAEKHFKAGVKFFNGNKFEKALKEFEASYAIYAHWKIRFNIGLCLVELKQDLEAAGQFQAFIEEGGSEVSADQLKEAQELLGELKKKLGTLVLTGQSGPWDVTIDGKLREGVKEGQDIILSTGTHSIKVAAGGKTVIEKQVNLEAGKTQKLAVPLPETKKVEKVKEPEKTVKPEKTPDKAVVEGETGKKPEKGSTTAAGKKRNGAMWGAGWGLFAAGVASLAVGGAMGGLEKKENDLMKDAENEYMDGFGTLTAEQLDEIKDRRDSHYDKSRTCYFAMWGLLGGGAALVIASIPLFVLSGKKKSEGKKGASATVLGGPWSLSVNVEF